MFGLFEHEFTDADGVTTTKYVISHQEPQELRSQIGFPDNPSVMYGRDWENGFSGQLFCNGEPTPGSDIVVICPFSHVYYRAVVISKQGDILTFKLRGQSSLLRGGTVGDIDENGNRHGLHENYDKGVSIGYTIYDHGTPIEFDRACNGGREVLRRVPSRAKSARN